MQCHCNINSFYSFNRHLLVSTKQCDTPTTSDGSSYYFCDDGKNWFSGNNSWLRSESWLRNLSWCPWKRVTFLSACWGGSPHNTCFIFPSFCFRATRPLAFKVYMYIHFIVQPIHPIQLHCNTFQVIFTKFPSATNCYWTHGKSQINKWWKLHSQLSVILFYDALAVDLKDP